MLKLYVDAKIRLNQSTAKLANRFENRDDSGFAAAENIALAVAGVLIVGGAYAFFNEKITDFLTNVSDTFTSIGG